MRIALLKEVGSERTTSCYVDSNVEIGQTIFYKGFIWEVIG